MGTLPRFRVVEVQEGGSGSTNWVPLGVYGDIGSPKVTGPSGGDTEVTSHYGRDYKTGKMKIVNQVVSGVPAPYTFDVELPMELRSILTRFKGRKNIRIRFFDGDYGTPTNYKKTLNYINGFSINENGNFGGDILNDVDNPGDQLRRTYPQQFADMVEVDPLTISDVSGSIIAYALNGVISIGYERWAGDVAGENENNPGDKEFLAISAVDGATFHHVLYTDDRWATVTDITGATANFIGQGIAKAGKNVVICGSGAGGGLMYTTLAAIIAGTATFTRSTGVSAGTVVNAVVAASASVLYAVGASGAVWKSTDAGVTFASLGTAVTANALTELVCVDDTLLWAGGASGTLVKIYKDVMSVVAVNGLSTTAINSLAVPPGSRRGQELFIGSAAGNVHWTANSLPSTGAPVFAARSFDNVGVGAVDGLAFAGSEGEMLYAIQTDGSSQSRLLRDHSGGKFGQDVEVLGAFTSPTNATYNALAVASPNCVVCVGDVSTVAKIVLYN